MRDVHSSPVYTVDEVVDTFTALLASLDFDHELALLGVGRFRFIRRKRLVHELRALAVALWKLALERSFPEVSERIFSHFLERESAGFRNPERGQRFEKTVLAYVALLAKRREADFTEAGAHIVGFFKFPEARAAALRLRLALQIRALYTLIFDQLI